MANGYQARWISKPRRDSLKRTGGLGGAVLLDSFNGFLVVEAIGHELGDGPVLSREEADYELSDVWCREPKWKIKEARKRLGLSTADATNVSLQLS